MSDNEEEVPKADKEETRSSPAHSPRQKDDDDEDRVKADDNDKDDDKDDDARPRDGDRRRDSSRDADRPARKDDRPEDANRGSTSLLVRNLSYDVRSVISHFVYNSVIPWIANIYTVVGFL